MIIGKETPGRKLLDKQIIPTKIGDIAVQELRYYPKNPRIYSVVAAGKEEEASQDEIFLALKDQQHVKTLIHTIQKHGGLREPVIVKAGTWEVIEGNSRLAAYKWLYEEKEDKVKWGKMLCEVLPADISDRLVNSLLAAYHLDPKTSWTPFEQAGFAARLAESDSFGTEELALQTGLTKRKIEKYVEAYKLMVEFEEPAIRFSHWYEYVNNKNIQKMRKEFGNCDEVVLEKVKSGEIKDAKDVRDRLSVIAKAKKKKIRKNFIEQLENFEESYEDASLDPNQNQIYTKTETFRQYLVREQTQLSVAQAGGETRTNIKYTLEQIQKKCGQLLKLLGPTS